MFCGQNPQLSSSGGEMGELLLGQKKDPNIIGAAFQHVTGP